MGLSRDNLTTIATRTGRRVVAAWSDRNAGAMGTIVGVVMHHTGSAWGTSVAPTLQIVREGRSDLQNALSTFYIDRAGTIYLITEKIPWHAGQGVYRGITDGNGHFLGIEAESDGVHWTTETVDAYVALVAEIARFLGVDPATWAIRHAVWATPPGRKTDFAGLNEADFRARVQARLNGSPTPSEDDMLPDERAALLDIAARVRGTDPNVDALQLLHMLIGDVHGKVVDSRFDLGGRPGPDADDLLGQVLSIRADVAALAAKVAKVQTGGVDAAEVAALVLAGLNGAQLNVQQAPGK